MNARATYFAATKAYQKGQYLSALEDLNRLLDIACDAKNYVLLAKTLIALKMPAEAAQSYESAARISSKKADEYYLRAMELYLEAGDEDRALLASKNLVLEAHKNPDIAFVLATIFQRRGEADLLIRLRKPLIDSSNVRHLNLGLQLSHLGPDRDDGRRAYAKALKLYPERHDLRFGYLRLLREICDFDKIRATNARFGRGLESRDPNLFAHEQPWSSLVWCPDEEINSYCLAGTKPISPWMAQKRRAMPHDWCDQKIRVGYLSSDFWSKHATMKLLGDVLRCHDRSRYEATLFCHTPSEFVAFNDIDRSQWGEIVPVGSLSDVQIAEVIRKRNIDILIDLKGHTRDNRCSVLNHAAAPIQVAWLGFPGSTVGIDVDYVIGDRFVLPDSSKSFYHEKFCRLPDTYQPNDPFNRPYPKEVSRRALGLPDEAFIFASFNQSQKVSAQMIALWSSILGRSPDSVLWLMTMGQETNDNLLKEFESHGVGAERIFFAQKIDYAQHIDRQACADLALDTFPCNGHTTTSDSLWGGLPVLTCKGTNFASRVSESLLNAIGLDGLVAHDPTEYVARAVELCGRPDILATYKEHICRSRFTQPLFDSERFCRHLERAFEVMVARARAKMLPDHFDVPPLPKRSHPFASVCDQGMVTQLSHP